MGAADSEAARRPIRPPPEKAASRRARHRLRRWARAPHPSPKTTRRSSVRRAVPSFRPGADSGEATPPWRPTGHPPAAKASGATRHPLSTTTRSTATSSRAPPFAHRPRPRRIRRWPSLRSVRRRRRVEDLGAATPPNRPSRASARARRARTNRRRHDRPRRAARFAEARARVPPPAARSTVDATTWTRRSRPS